MPNHVGLARPWRPVQQDAPLEVLPCGAESLPSLPDVDDVARDPLEHSVGQDDLVRAHLRPAQEPQVPAAALVVEGVQCEGDHLTAQRAELRHPLVQQMEEAVRSGAVGRKQLKCVGLPTVLTGRRALQKNERSAVERQLTHAVGDDAPIGVRARPLACVRQGSQPGAPLRRDEQLGEGVDVHPVQGENAMPLAAELGQQRLDGDVHVHDLVGQKGLHDRLHAVGCSAQEGGDVRRGRALVVAFRRGCPLHRLHKTGE